LAGVASFAFSSAAGSASELNSFLGVFDLAGVFGLLGVMVLAGAAADISIGLT